MERDYYMGIIEGHWGYQVLLEKLYSDYVGFYDDYMGIL